MRSAHHSSISFCPASVKPSDRVVQPYPHTGVHRIREPPHCDWTGPLQPTVLYCMVLLPTRVAVGRSLALLGHRPSGPLVGNFSWMTPFTNCPVKPPIVTLSRRFLRRGLEDLSEPISYLADLWFSSEPFLPSTLIMPTSPPMPELSSGAVRFGLVRKG